MARTVLQGQINPNTPNVEATIASILRANKFEPYTYSTGEQVWKNGEGILTASKYIKVEYLGQTLILTAWILNNGVVESKLNGFVGCVPKSIVKKVVSQIQQAVCYAGQYQRIV